MSAFKRSRGNYSEGDESEISPTKLLCASPPPSPGDRPTTPSPCLEQEDFAYHPELHLTRSPSPPPSSPYRASSKDYSRPPSPCASFEDERAEQEENCTPFTSDAFEDPTENYTDENCEDLFEQSQFYPLNERDRPVYKSAPLTLHESLVAILSFSLKYSLSGQCIQDLLRLINLHCSPEENVLKKSLYLFKKYFADVQGLVSYRYFCSKCYQEVPSKVCGDCEGPPPLCYLITLPIIDQLGKMFKRQEFYSKLRFSYEKKENNISDVCDGKLFEDLLKQGVIGQPDILTFSWYTDGVLIFDSSKISGWLLELSINNLPYRDRFKKENLLVPAIWVGPVKPHGNLLLESTYPALQQLRRGVAMQVHSHGTKKIKGVVTNGTADSPARALMLNMVAHNGERSCQKCYQPGECREGCFGVRVFPYRPLEMETRTEEKFEREGALVGKMSHVSSYMGLKGPTLLTQITSYPVRGTAIDAMHLVYGGVCKLLTKLLLDKSNTTLPFNVFNSHVHLIDNRLLQIKVPAYLTRVPQSLLNIANWKTALLKSWCLYFCLPVLRGTVGDLNFRHLSSLIAAIQLLNGESISPEDLNQAKQLIVKFISFFEDMYGRHRMTLNVHLLLHLPEVVQDQGGLWTTACFPQESVNGVVLNLVHGTRYIEMQIASALNMHLGLPDLIRGLKDSAAKCFSENLMRTTTKCKTKLVQDTAIIGNMVKIDYISAFCAEAAHLLDVCPTDILTFHSIRKDRCLYVAESYHRSKVRDSSCASYWDDNEIKVGLIKTFLKAPCTCEGIACNCDLYVAMEKLNIVESIPTLIPSISVPNIHVYEKQNVISLIRTNALHDVCVKMQIEDKLYIAKRCNRLEVE